MQIDTLKAQLIQHEGLRLKPYRCPSGRLTIGVGRNLDDRGISKQEAMDMLDRDIKEFYAALVRLIPCFSSLSEVRQHVLIDMCFTLGVVGLMGFDDMIIALNNGDFSRAADEMVNSKWYRQLGNRPKTLVEMMRNG